MSNYGAQKQTFLLKFKPKAIIVNKNKKDQPPKQTLAINGFFYEKKKDENKIVSVLVFVHNTLENLEFIQKVLSIENKDRIAKTTFAVIAESVSHEIHTYKQKSNVKLVINATELPFQQIKSTIS